MKEFDPRNHVLEEGLFSPVRNNRKPKGYWTPEKVVEESKKYLASGGDLTAAGLKASDTSLFWAINRYAGGVGSLRESLGLVAVPAIPRRRSSAEPRPNRYWLDPENIEAEAKSFYEEHGTLRHYVLFQHGSKDLATRISRYPGGIHGMREKLGIIEENQRNAKGSWTVERIKEEAKGFVEEHGNITRRLMTTAKKQGLANAIGLHYPGKLRGLKVDLGLSAKRENGYWTEEQIEKEAVEFVSTHGEIGQNLLIENGRLDLLTAIRRKYPGRMPGLVEKLGLGESSLATLLKAYEQVLRSGQSISFEDFLKGEK